MSAPTIGFIGQGYVGKNMADDFERRGHTVVRYALEKPYAANKDKIKDCDIVFIAVPTPTSADGFDVSIVKSALSLVAPAKTAVIKSTVTPGTTAALQREVPDRIVLCSPEFLSEATAAHDAAHPHVNVVGMAADDAAHRSAAAAVHTVLPPSPAAITCTSAEAEIIKYVRNSNGYTQVVFMNMMYDLAAVLGCDWNVVYRAIDADPFVTTRYAQPLHKSGRGAGGHCFIKDYAAFRDAYERLLPHDTEAHAVLHAHEAKNIALLRGSGKDLDLLAGVYGSRMLSGVPARAVTASDVVLDIKLLLCAQSVDSTDPALGFFGDWLREFAHRARAVTFIHLQGTPAALPENVRAFSLRKETTRGPHLVKRLRFALRFLRRIWRERNAYDAVLVHINTEYVMLGGLVWKLLGKRVALWVNNAELSWKVRLAARFSDVLFHTDPHATVAGFPQAIVLPTGIETRLYAGERHAAPGSLLFLGRLAPEKRVDVVIDAVAQLAETGMPVSLDIIGSTILPGDEQYAAELRARIASQRGAAVTLHDGIPHAETPQAYAGHEIFVHAGSVSGFNMALFEAIAAGCIVVTVLPELRAVVHEGLYIESPEPEHVARAIRAALALSDEEKERERAALRSYVEREHALSSVAPRVLERLVPQEQAMQR